MPIRDLSYQRFGGAPGRRGAVEVLVRAHLRLLARRLTMRLLLLVAAIFTLSWGAQVYLEVQAPSQGPLAAIASMAQLGSESLHRFLTWQRLLHLLVCLAAIDAIARDRRHRALQVYLARPLRARDYVLARAVAVGLLLSLVSWIPALLLIAFKTALTASILWLAPEPWLPLAVVAYGLVLVGSCTLLTLAVSSLSTSPLLAGVQFFAFVAVAGTVGEVVAALSRQPAWQTLSLNADLDLVAALLFAVPTRVDAPPALAFAMLAAIAGASVLVLRSRVRPVDVVGGG